MPEATSLQDRYGNLNQQPELVTVFKEILKASKPLKLEQMQEFKLQTMGLVNLQGNQISVCCDLYRQYFRDRLQV